LAAYYSYNYAQGWDIGASVTPFAIVSSDKNRFGLQEHFAGLGEGFSFGRFGGAVSVFGNKVNKSIVPFGGASLDDDRDYTGVALGRGIYASQTTVLLKRLLIPETKLVGSYFVGNTVVPDMLHFRYNRSIFRR
jgi:hypothetical protein